MVLKELDNFVKEDEESQDDDKLQKLIEDCRGIKFYRWGSFETNNNAFPTGIKNSGITIKNHDSTRFIRLPRHKDSFGRLFKVSCRYNHIIGLPMKGNKFHPLYDYEKDIYRALMVPNYANSSPSRFVDISLSYRERLDIMSDANRGILNVYSQNKIKHVAILKAAGLGITEFILRFMTWLCLRNDDLKGSQMIIFTGPRLELAVSLIQRMKDLFKHLGITISR